MDRLTAAAAVVLAVARSCPCGEHVIVPREDVDTLADALGIAAEHALAELLASEPGLRFLVPGGDPNLN